MSVMLTRYGGGLKIKEIGREEIGKATYLALSTASALLMCAGARILLLYFWKVPSWAIVLLCALPRR